MRTIAGRYELDLRLGESTWRATDTELGREVLVRFGAPRVAAALSHPNLERVFDHGVDDGEPFEVMEYVTGETLAQREELPVGAAAGLAAALAHAHEHGVTHGAISADNVRFDPDGNPKLVGFLGTGTEAEDRAALADVVAAYPEAAPTFVAAHPPEEATVVRQPAVATPSPSRRRGS